MSEARVQGLLPKYVATRDVDVEERIRPFFSFSKLADVVRTGHGPDSLPLLIVGVFHPSDNAIVDSSSLVDGPALCHRH